MKLKSFKSKLYACVLILSAGSMCSFTAEAGGILSSLSHENESPSENPTALILNPAPAANSAPAVIRDAPVSNYNDIKQRNYTEFMSRTLAEQMTASDEVMNSARRHLESAILVGENTQDLALADRGFKTAVELADEVYQFANSQARDAKRIVRGSTRSRTENGEVLAFYKIKRSKMRLLARAAYAFIGQIYAEQRRIQALHEQKGACSPKNNNPMQSTSLGALTSDVYKSLTVKLPTDQEVANFTWSDWL